jgi:hypothetical protein
MRASRIGWVETDEILSREQKLHAESRLANQSSIRLISGSGQRPQKSMKPISMPWRATSSSSRANSSKGTSVSGGRDEHSSMPGTYS